MNKHEFYPVGSVVTPKQEYDERDRLYTAGKPYTVIKTDDAWNYIHRDDGTGLVGVATFVLELYKIPQMLEAEFTLDEIAQAKDIMEELL